MKPVIFGGIYHRESNVQQSMTAKAL